MHQWATTWSASQFCQVALLPHAKADEVTVQDMMKALDNPNLGIKVIDVGEPDEYEIAQRGMRAVAAVEPDSNRASRNSIRTSNIICTAKPACVR
jgi:hypothetical protein